MAANAELGQRPRATMTHGEEIAARTTVIGPVQEGEKRDRHSQRP